MSRIKIYVYDDTMGYFLDKKLNKALPFILLDEGKLDEGIFAFLKYIKMLNCLFLFKTKRKAIKEFSAKLEALASEYSKKKDNKSAITCYYHIYKFDKKNEENINNYIQCLKEIGQNDLEEALAKYLVKINPIQKNLKTLAQSYSHNKNFKKAIATYKKTINENNPTDMDYSWLGFFNFSLYKETHDPQYAKSALKYFKKADAKKPNDSYTIKNLCSCYRVLKDFEYELYYWLKYSELAELSEEDKLTIAISAMKADDFKNWEKYYDARFTIPKGNAHYPDIKKPRYKGSQNIKEKTLLVHCEQGFGDTFMCFGYVPRLLKLCKKLIFVAQDELYELLKNSEYEVEIYPKTVNLEDLEFDYHIPMMSIPCALKISKNDVLFDESYIKPDNQLVEKYKKEYFNTPKLKIGIAYSGDKRAGERRDIPQKLLKKFNKIKNAQLYCLTKDTDDYILEKTFGKKIINIAKSFNNFSDTAAAIANTDLIISSDNCILNLAGAMGKNTIGLFDYDYHSRWVNLNDVHSGYYKSVKPIINDEYNNWEKTVKKVLDIVNKKEY